MSEPVHEQNARWAIDGAITQGYQNTNKPPSDDHWLMQYWIMGRKLSSYDQGFTAPAEEAKPVAYQYRCLYRGDFGWSPCAQQEAEDMAKSLYFEVRPLYLHPAPPAVQQENAENKILRRLLASTYCGTPLLYTDDGELQDNRVQPAIDFNRDSAERIAEKMRIRGLNKYAEQVASLGLPPDATLEQVLEAHAAAPADTGKEG